MAGPNFSESQLQAAVNGAIVRDVWEQHGIWILPNVVSLWYEFDLGWDSAFDVPWYPTGDPNQEGCNLFVQYKLSELLVSPGASQWANWSAPYFRFVIPHSKLNVSKRYVEDYHQWECLVKISAAGYTTLYATNHTLSKTELKKHHDSGELLNRTAWLNVKDVTQKHRHVTFMENSRHFFLHSELEEVRRIRIREVLALLSSVDERETMLRANNKLIRLLQDLPGDRYRQGIQRIALLSERLGDQKYAHYIHLLLRSFVHKELGCNLLWVPRR